jgi:peptide/nickel transport system permease protein
MFFYLIRRIAYAIPIALAVGFVCFMLVQIAPGDPINAIVPPDAPGKTTVLAPEELPVVREDV